MTTEAVRQCCTLCACQSHMIMMLTSLVLNRLNEFAKVTEP